jgi:hypothetical protein
VLERDRVHLVSTGPTAMKPGDKDLGGGHRRPSLEGPAVVAHTTEDDQHAEVRHAAEVHAKEHGCVLILYAADVASWWSEPMPNQWASEGEGDRFGDRLSPKDLEALGRSTLAAQVREGRRTGAKASAWLPKDKGVGALAEYAASQAAHALFVPESLDSIDELRSLLATGGREGTAKPSIDLRSVPEPSSARRSSASDDHDQGPA